MLTLNSGYTQQEIVEIMLNNKEAIEQLIQEINMIVDTLAKEGRIQLVIATLPPLVCVKNFNRTFIV